MRGRDRSKVPIGTLTITEAAEQANVGVRTVKRARAVEESATPEIVEAVEQGEVAVSVAASIAKETRPAPYRSTRVSTSRSTHLTQLLQNTRKPLLVWIV
jgi:hypothetical protein